jgi:hypothetical protein
MQRLGILRIGLRQEPRPASFSKDPWDEVLYLREKTNSYTAILREGEFGRRVPIRCEKAATWGRNRYSS